MAAAIEMNPQEEMLVALTDAQTNGIWGSVVAFIGLLGIWIGFRQSQWRKMWRRVDSLEAQLLDLRNKLTTITDEKLDLERVNIRLRARLTTVTKESEHLTKEVGRLEFEIKRLRDWRHEKVNDQQAQTIQLGMIEKDVCKVQNEVDELLVAAGKEPKYRNGFHESDKHP